MSVALLPSSTIRLVTTTQIITTVSSVVKELLENSLDARATNVEVRLERNGLERIEVKDNGCGIATPDIPNVCLSSYTSKIQNYSDLGTLSTYGFRGEALSALCQVSSITITTKTVNDNIAVTYAISQDGSILNSRPTHFGNVSGTHIVVTELFKNLPVRKQYLSNSRNASEDLKKTEQIVKSMAVIHPDVRITFCHNKGNLWQKPVVSTLQESFMHVFGYSISSNLEQLVYRREQVNFELLVPMKNCTDIPALCQTNSSSIMTYFNKRPIKYAKIDKVITKVIKQYFGGKFPPRKYPICVVTVNVPADLIDVNLEPNKIKVLCKDENTILSSIEEMLIEYYGIQKEEETENCKRPVSKINRKLKFQSAPEEDRVNKRSKLIVESHDTLESSVDICGVNSLSSERLKSQSAVEGDRVNNWSELITQSCNILESPQNTHGSIGVLSEKQLETPLIVNGSNVHFNRDRTLVENVSDVCQESTVTDYFDSAASKETVQCGADFQGIQDIAFQDRGTEVKNAETKHDFLHSPLELPKNPAASTGDVFCIPPEKGSEQRNSIAPQPRDVALSSQPIKNTLHETTVDMPEFSKICNDFSLGIDNRLPGLIDDDDDVFFGFDTLEQDASQQEKERAKKALEAAKPPDLANIGKSCNVDGIDKEQWSKGSVKTKSGTTIEERFLTHVLLRQRS